MAPRKRILQPVSPTRRGGGTGKGRPPNPYSRTRIIARAMILAAEELSPDGTLLGFLIEAGKKDRDGFMSALMRVMHVQGLEPHESIVKYFSRGSGQHTRYRDGFHRADQYIWSRREGSND